MSMQVLAARKHTDFILDFLATSDFRRRFEEKGRLRAYLEAIPTQVIVHPAATFLGLTSLALKSASHS